MSTATKAPARSLKKPTLPEMLPASCELPSGVHAKVATAARDNERSFAAQLRLIVKEWAERQPAGAIH